ncbi:serine/threonine-protein kinase [Actinomadura oligospora]|uniref:serine/threonine-protein kinase n=1 Tax=Actinomadura oligospora TaxID=111804 RepID=UPI000A0727B4|nr:serine/threonine-protein kinase [Actinomadura oligospora]
MPPSQGTPPSTGQQPPIGQPQQRSAAQPAGPRKCTQPGCDGTIQDGYCDVCGSAAEQAPPPAPVPVPATGSGPSGSGTSGRAPVTRPSTPSASSGSFASGSVMTGSVGTGSGGTRSTGRRGQLGSGLVEVPRVPYRDPATAVRLNPEVPENRRHCGNCGEKVGRSRGDQPGRTEGFCPKCGHAFSFTPKLKPGDMVHRQYEVLGCLAHGGLGWIYLARDHRVNGRWVVLKGLLNTGDADAREAAEAEREFLATVEHPNIVKIYNFVEHAGDEYIVMEYVGGKSLKDILLEHRNTVDKDGLPPAQAIAYALEVLHAFSYLHARGLVYCDFKPDNVIQSEEQLRLIDLGGVRRLDDQDGAIYGTVGYQAPEIAERGPSVTSDLYTVGRALAVMTFPFKGYTSEFSDRIPPRAEVPLLARFESFDRLLRRATHLDPDQRFQDAEEMADQLLGVLREVLAAEDGHPRQAASGLFGPERFASADAADAATAGDALAPALPALTPAQLAASLPAPLVDGSDPAAGFLAGLTALDPAQLAATVEAAPDRTPEVKLTLARVRIELGQPDRAEELLREVAAERPHDWRIEWYRAVALLAAGRVEPADAAFDRLYSLMPGELAPKMALAACREHRAPQSAAHLYETVWRTDRNHINAAFGLARVKLAADDRPGAVAVLDSVPATSIRFVPAQVAAVGVTVRGRDAGRLTPDDLITAARRLERLDLTGERRDLLTAEVLEAALDWTMRHRAPGTAPGAAQGGDVFGVPLAEQPLRRHLEGTYRALARLTGDREEKRLLVDAANAVRPRTLL